MHQRRVTLLVFLHGSLFVRLASGKLWVMRSPNQTTIRFSNSLTTMQWSLCVLLAALLCTAVHVKYRFIEPVSSLLWVAPASSLGSRSAAVDSLVSDALTTHYMDPDVGFGARVPVGWYRDADKGFNEAGHAVSFQSPPSHAGDQYSDYIMVALSPGPFQPVFTQPVSETVPIVIAGHDLIRERLVLKADDKIAAQSLETAPIDLVMWRVVMAFADFSVALYAVGEPAEEPRLERLFLEFSHAFELYELPFIST